MHTASVPRVALNEVPDAGDDARCFALAPVDGEGDGGTIVIFQLGGAVLAGGVPDEADRRTRDLLYRYGEAGLARKLPSEDRGLDLRGTIIHPWGEEAPVIGRLYRAYCGVHLLSRIARGERLEVPYTLAPDEPIVVMLARQRLTLTAAIEEAEPPANAAMRPFTTTDILQLREFGRDPVIPQEAAEAAIKSAAGRFLKSFAALVERPAAVPEPVWLAKAARKLNRAADAIDLALRFAAGGPAAPSLRRQMAELEARG